MNLSLAQKETVTRLLESGVQRSMGLLARMSHTKWGVAASSINEIPVVRLLSWFQREKGHCVGARFRARSDVPLDFLVLFTDPSSKSVAEAVTRPFSARMARLPNLVKLTIGEVSNILAQGVVGALADEFNTTIILSVPDIQEGTKTEILERALADYDGREDILMMSHVDMYSERLSAECSMIIIVNSESLRRLLS